MHARSRCPIALQRSKAFRLSSSPNSKPSVQPRKTHSLSTVVISPDGKNLQVVPRRRLASFRLVTGCGGCVAPCQLTACGKMRENNQDTF